MNTAPPRRFLAALAAALSVTLSAATSRAEVVSRDIGDPSVNPWKEDAWVTCDGGVTPVADRPDESAAPAGAMTLRCAIRYPAGTHGGWKCHPASDTIIPGRFQRLSLWIRPGADGEKKIWGTAFNFTDANGVAFGLDVPFARLEQGKWAFLDLKVPEKIKRKDKETGKEEHVDVAFPVKFTGFGMENWFDRQNPKSVERVVDIHDLRAFTDVADVPPGERPHSLAVSFPATANVFYYGEDAVQVRVSASSWLGAPVVLSGSGSVTSADGETRPFQVPPFEVLDNASLLVPLPFANPGAYTMTLEVAGFGGPPLRETHRYAVVPRPPALTEAQRLASPYGLNVHGGGSVGYANFARLGFVWLRDYAFDYNWMNRARGAGNFAGWPNFPKIVQTGESFGFKTLPCLKSAIRFDSKNPDWPRAPTVEWRRDVARIVTAIDGLSCFELDNEKDVVKHDFPSSYDAYHRAFGEIMKAARPDALAVQEGAAGIDVDATRRSVLNGSFRDIDVCNGHRYCGIDAPEFSRSNLNTGRGEDRKTFLRDLWRQWRAAASADGKSRQLWLTEWGWDTRAGQIVSEWEQAAYMQREWVLGMGNGIDKMFWYYHYDEDTDTPTLFFDGCGIFDRFREPKPVAAAFAALRAFLPADMTSLGYASLSPNHMAHVLRLADGSLVAMAFKIRARHLLGDLDPKFEDLEIKDPPARRVCDMFGRELKRGRRTLDVAPTWYLGLDEDCDWVRQCPIDLESDFLVRNVAGEPLEVRVANAESCRYSVEAPAGWTVTPRPGGFTVASPAATPRGSARFLVTGRNGRATKAMTVEVDIVPQAFVRSRAAAFDGSFDVEVVNQSAAPQRFTVAAALPAGWTLEPPSQMTPLLEPDAAATLKFRIAASPSPSPRSPRPAPDSPAHPRLVVTNPAQGGVEIDSVPVIPRDWAMPRAGAIAIDGDLADWPAAARFPSWMVGPRGAAEPSAAYFAWAPDGLYFALDAEDSRCAASDPRSFWRAADCLELMLSAPGAAFSPSTPWSTRDHQFWFCPLPGESRAYAGLWPNCKEQRAGLPDGAWAHYDIADVTTALRRKATGYTLEGFIPASRIGGWGAAAEGQSVGLMFSVNAQGLRDPREFFWPVPKAGDAVKKPWLWGRVTLGPAPRP